MSEHPDHYRTLRVSAKANAAQVQRAYHSLAKRYHPDRVSPARQEWARQEMARINVAYEVLSDPQKRARYDYHYNEIIASGQASPAQSGDAMWRGKRLRERSRRQRMERWRVVSIASLATLAIGLLATALFSRTVADYVVAALVNGALLGLLLVSLAMRNRA